MADLLFS